MLSRCWRPGSWRPGDGAGGRAVSAGGQIALTRVLTVPDREALAQPDAYPDRRSSGTRHQVSGCDELSAPTGWGPRPVRSTPFRHRASTWYGTPDHLGHPWPSSFLDTPGCVYGLIDVCQMLP